MVPDEYDPKELEKFREIRRKGKERIKG